jgi:hypothetical protein
VANQAANAAVRAKGTIFNVVYRRLVPRLGHAQPIGVITHRLCRLIRQILHQEIRYEERGSAVSTEAKKLRARKMIRDLRSLGYSAALATGQGTTVAMVGTYVLAGELATHKNDLVAGTAAYEDEQRDHVLRNQDAALEQNADQERMMADEPMEAEETVPADDLPDFGQVVQPIILKNYPELVQ